MGDEYYGLLLFLQDLHDTVLKEVTTNMHVQGWQGIILNETEIKAKKRSQNQILVSKKKKKIRRLES